jgi:hypothetical protein
MPGPATKSRLLKLALVGAGVVLLGAAGVIAWGALETYVFAERIHLLTSENRLQVGMTQEEVEDLLGVKPEDGQSPERHDGVRRDSEIKHRNGVFVNYSEWYHGLIVTSQHHLHVRYDRAGKLKAWQRL